jgi:hypothetical protein
MQKKITFNSISLKAATRLKMGILYGGGSLTTSASFGIGSVNNKN